MKAFIFLLVLFGTEVVAEPWGKSTSINNAVHSGKQATISSDGNGNGLNDGAAFVGDLGTSETGNASSWLTTAAEVLLEGVSSDGSIVTGFVHITQGNGRGLITLVGSFFGLTPGFHGIRVTEYANRTTKGCQSTGETLKLETGESDTGRRSIGDVGYLRVGFNRVGNLFKVDSFLSLNGPNSIVGRTLVVDEVSRLANSSTGVPAACGLVAVVKGYRVPFNNHSSEGRMDGNFPQTSVGGTSTTAATVELLTSSSAVLPVNESLVQETYEQIMQVVNTGPRLELTTYIWGAVLIYTKLCL